MAEGVEAGHKSYQKEERGKIVEELPEVDACFGSSLGLAPLLSFQPDRGLLDLELHVERKQGRKRTYHEHHPPPGQHPGSVQVREDKAVKGCGQQVTDDIALLQDARKGTPPLGREGLKRKRGADPPLASHCDPEQRSADHKGGQRWSKCGGQLGDGEADDIQNQRWSTTDPLRQKTEDQGSQRAHHQCPEDRLRDRGDTDMEISGDRLKAYREKEEIKGVEGPAKKAC